MMQSRSVMQLDEHVGERGTQAARYSGHGTVLTPPNNTYSRHLTVSIVEVYFLGAAALGAAAAFGAAAVLGACGAADSTGSICGTGTGAAVVGVAGTSCAGAGDKAGPSAIPGAGAGGGAGGAAATMGGLTGAAATTSCS